MSLTNIDYFLKHFSSKSSLEKLKMPKNKTQRISFTQCTPLLIVVDIDVSDRKKKNILSRRFLSDLGNRLISSH